MKIEADNIRELKLFGPKFYRVIEEDGKKLNKIKGISLR